MPRNRSWVILATRVRTLSGDSLRALRTRRAWNSAAAGVISGWRPLTEVVTKIDRQQRRRVLRFELLRIILDAVDQRPAGRHTIRPSRVRGVVRCRDGL